MATICVKCCRIPCHAGKLDLDRHFPTFYLWPTKVYIIVMNCEKFARIVHTGLLIGTRCPLVQQAFKKQGRGSHFMPLLFNRGRHEQSSNWLSVQEAITFVFYDARKWARKAKFLGQVFRGKNVHYLFLRLNICISCF